MIFFNFYFNTHVAAVTLRFIFLFNAASDLGEGKQKKKRFCTFGSGGDSSPIDELWPLIGRSLSRVHLFTSGFARIYIRSCAAAP